MRKQLAFILFKTLWAQPRARRKVKIFAVVGLVAALLMGSFVVAGGIVAYQALAKVPQMFPATAELSLADIQTKLVNATPGALVNCWNKAEKLLSTDAWFRAPLMANFAELKEACWPAKADACLDDTCTQLDLQKALDGRVI